MGCFGSKEEGGPKQAARRQSDGGGSGRERKQSRFETDLNTPPVKKLPEPDKPLLSGVDSKKCQEMIEGVLERGMKRKFFRGELDMENLNLHDYCEENDEEVEETLLWKHFGRIPLVTTAKSIKFGYSDFNKLEECGNFVNCRKINFESCDFEKCDFSKAKFPKLLQELNVSESQFQGKAWDALKNLEYLTTLIASGMDENLLPTRKGVLPKCITSVDLGASEFDWNILADLPNLERVDLRGAYADLSGDCPLPKTLLLLDVEETNFDDIKYLQALGEDCNVIMSPELREQYDAALQE